MGRDQSDLAFPYRLTILDISATGIKMMTDRNLPEGTKPEFQFVLPILPFRDMVLVGEVIRSVPASEKADHPIFETGVSFKNIRESDQEQIIRFVL